MARATAADAVLAGWLEPLAPLAAVVTQLGDTWLLGGLVLAVYLLGPRAPGFGHDTARVRGASLLALLLAALATTVALKGVIAAPRPPGGPATVAGPEWLRTAYHLAAGGDGYAFPSGHALGATVVWGGLAALADWRTRRERALAAAGMVAVVGLTRVALGVHYLVDVAAGVALGLAVLGVGLGPARSPRGTFGLAAVAGLAAAGLAAEVVEGAALCGATVGAGLAWTALGERVGACARDQRAAWGGLAAGALLAGGGGLLLAFVPMAPAVGVGTALLTAAVVALPLGVDRAKERLGSRAG
jgi:membrane-associated phospholipid phosphatase